MGTIGIDFISHTIKTEKGVVRIQIWDTAGQERFHALVGTLQPSLFIIFMLLLSWLFSSVFFLFCYFHLHFFLFLKWCRFQPMCEGPR